MAGLLHEAVLPAASGGLGLPIACVVGETCQVQNYVELDRGPGARDYRCGTRTYDAHSRVDFRLLDSAAQRLGVDVVAAADGVVARIRDGVPDISVTKPGLTAVADQECGNGVVIDHGGGLSSQSCHLANGSIRVRPGETVTAGQKIATVGLSGQTEYPHLHFTVRQGTEVVDPFAPGPAAEGCTAGPSLWNWEAAAALTYHERGVLNVGFTTAPVTMEAIEAATLPRPVAGGTVIVAYERAIGLKAGDLERLEVTGPDGRSVAENTGAPTPRAQAQRMIFSGARRRDTGFPGGRYTGVYTVENGGRHVLQRRFAITLE